MSFPKMQIKIIIVQVTAASRLEACCSCCGLICFFICFDLGFKNISFRIIKQNYFELFLNYFLNHHNLLTIKHKKSQGKNPSRSQKIKKTNQNKLKKLIVFIGIK